MRIIRFIEAHFWAFLIFAMFVGLVLPLPAEQMIPLLKPELMLTLFFIFLKIDILQVLERIRDLRLMIYLLSVFLILSPLAFFYVFVGWDLQWAIALALLMAMPAGTSSAVLTDIVKGNTALSMSLTILTSLLVPFTLPLVFFLIGQNGLELNSWLLFWESATMVLIPMVLATVVKPLFPRLIKRSLPTFTAINILILFLIVVTSFGSQRAALLANPLSLVWDLLLMYGVFILLHVLGYLWSYGKNSKDRIAITVSHAYMNNGLAIVLAAKFFSPTVLILMVLSEIPWSTMLVLLRWVIRNTRFFYK